MIKNIKCGVIVSILLWTISCSARKEQVLTPEKQDEKEKEFKPFSETHNRAGSPYSIQINIGESGINTGFKEAMVNLFFQVYPSMVDYINPNAGKKVIVNIGPYEGLAYAMGGQLYISKRFFNEKYEHIDVLTHEATHFIQDYKVSSMFMQEGLPDFVRHNLNLPSAETGWSLGEYKPGDLLSNYYAAASRFLIWVDKRIKEGVVLEMDKACRAGTYTPKIWWDQFGMSAEELWDIYVKNPSSSGAVIDLENYPRIEGGSLPSGVYKLLNKGTGFSADVEGASSDNSAKIVQWDPNNGLNQRWQFIHVGDNYYRIFTGFSSKVIEVSLNGGAPVTQYEWVGSANQLWRPVANEDGTYSLINKHSGLYLSIGGQSVNRGAAVIQEEGSISEKQKWRIIE